MRTGTHTWLRLLQCRNVDLRSETPPLRPRTDFLRDLRGHVRQNLRNPHGVGQ